MGHPVYGEFLSSDKTSLTENIEKLTKGMSKFAS